MAWTYSDWRTYTTPATKLARLRLHMQEAADSIGPNVAADGSSVDRDAMITYLGALEKSESALESALGQSGGTTYASFTQQAGP